MAPRLSERRGDGWEKQSRAWHDLPLEILCLFAELLYFRDQIRFRAVCKSWSVVKGIRSIDKLPWLMSYGRDDDNNILTACHLFDPSVKKSYTLRSATEYGEEERKDFIDAEVMASKDGWLLLANFSAGDQTPPVFFYNPFESKMIKLPKLPYRHSRYDSPTNPSLNIKFTFSANPASASSECVIFVVRNNLVRKKDKLPSKIAISTYRLGDPQEWSTYVFYSRCALWVYDLVYSKEKGKLYCVFGRGVLGVFCCARRAWRVLSPVCVTRAKRLHMIESEEELLLVLVENNSPNDQRPLPIFSFNWSRLRWVEKDGLGNRAVFLNDEDSAFAVSAVGDISGNVCYRVLGDTDCRLYSPQTRTHQLSSEFHLLGVHNHFTNVWIQPPH